MRKTQAAFYATAITIGSTAVLAGCATDPKAATTENFARVISARYAQAKNDDKSSVCLQTSKSFSDVLPTTISRTLTLANPKGPDIHPETGMFDTLVENPDSISKLQVLASVGVLIKKPITISGRRGAWFKPVKVRLPAFTYTPTSYCYATLGFDHVENFSVPGDLMGHHVTEVTYFRKIDNVKEWGKNARVRAAFPEIDQSLTQVKAEPAKMILELTNNGWQAAQ